MFESLSAHCNQTHIHTVQVKNKPSPVSCVYDAMHPYKRPNPHCQILLNPTEWMCFHRRRLWQTQYICCDENQFKLSLKSGALKRRPICLYGCWTDWKKWKWLCTIFVFGFFPFSLSLLFFSRHHPGHRIQFVCDWLWGEELRCGNHLFEWGHGHKLGTASPYIKPWQYILLNKSSSGKLENAKKKKKPFHHFV